MKSKERDLIRLNHMVEAVTLILEACEEKTYQEFMEDEIFQSAIVRQFEILGEASSNISLELKSEFSHVEWEQMRRFRNFLIHEYFRVDNAQIWSTINDELPTVKRELELIIDQV